jgi:hypothetical protein
MMKNSRISWRQHLSSLCPEKHKHSITHMSKKKKIVLPKITWNTLCANHKPSRIPAEFPPDEA